MYTSKNLSKWYVIVLLLVFCFVLAKPVFARRTDQTDGVIRYVKAGGTGDCSSWVQACELQTALYIATPGDQIWVAAGTYKPTTSSNRSATFQMKSGVAIYGGFPAEGGDETSRDWQLNKTYLSGDIVVPGNINDNCYHVVTAINVDVTGSLDGFYVVNGNANSEDRPDNEGGGIYLSNAAPTLTNVTFSENTATYAGGGMYNNGSPSLTNVTFSENTATYDGGGMYNSGGNATLTNVTFVANTATYSGGGMYNYDSSATLTNVTFSENTAKSGGGMYIDYNSSATLTNVTFVANTAESGGGMFNSGDNATLTDVTFSGNTATYRGGGMDNSGNAMLTNVTFSANTATYHGGGMYNYYSSATLTNVTFSTNTAESGGGMYNYYYSSATLTNVTFSTNTAEQGGGMSNYSSTATLTNAILWDNSPDQIVGESFVVTYSDIQGGYPGEGNINSAPLLGPLEDNGGFTLTHALLEGSPAIDAGDISVCPLTDQRLFFRPVDGNSDGIEGCDMGAYEYGSYPATYTVNISIFGNGNVIKDPEKEFYDYGEIVTLTAVADPGWSFGGWGGDASGLENPKSLTVTNDLSISATFMQDEYTLSVSINPPEQGTVTITPIKPFYHYGDMVTLTAIPELGWSFAGWSGDAAGSDNPLTITITGNTEITANFQKFWLYLPLISR